MKANIRPHFEVIVADHYGMCFGVKKALEKAELLLGERPATILGQLAHNKSVESRLQVSGAAKGDLSNTSATTRDVIITAHGAADVDRERWRNADYEVTDTTCPLVHKAHNSLRRLVAEGFAPIVIGQEGHVEVNGLVGDFPQAQVVMEMEDIASIPFAEKIGVISQTTQPIDHVLNMVVALQLRHPDAKVVFKDTVCQPTKDRQHAMKNLCRKADSIVVVGGKNSNNTAQLVKTARSFGCVAQHVEEPGDLNQDLFRSAKVVGVTAGTSTLEESVTMVVDRLKRVAEEMSSKQKVNSNR